jgi:hypothetical protein
MKLVDQAPSRLRAARAGRYGPIKAAASAPSASSPRPAPAARVSGLFVYPVKSCKGIAVQQSVMTPSGERVSEAPPARGAGGSPRASANPARPRPQACCGTGTGSWSRRRAGSSRSGSYPGWHWCGPGRREPQHPRPRPPQPPDPRPQIGTSLPQAALEGQGWEQLPQDAALELSAPGMPPLRAPLRPGAGQASM